MGQQKVKAMHVGAILAAQLILAPHWASGQTACGVPATALALNPNVIRLTSPDHDAQIAGSSLPMLTEYQIGVFLDGVDPQLGGQPVTSLTVPRAAWTLVPGEPSCVEARPAELISLAPGSLLRVAVRTRRTSPDVAESAWSALSNPFSRTATLAAPTGVRVTRP